MNLTEIIEELTSHGIPAEDAHRIVAQLIGIGAKAAAFRIKTIEDVEAFKPAVLRVVAKDEGGKDHEAGKGRD